MTGDRLALDVVAAMIAVHVLERFVSDVIIEGVFGRYDQSHEWSYDWSDDGDCAGFGASALDG